LFWLGFFHQLYREYLERALKINEEDLVESKKLDNPSLLFASLFWKGMDYFTLVMRSEGFEIIKEIEDLFERRISKSTPDYKKIKADFGFIKVSKQVFGAFEGELMFRDPGTGFIYW